ncbi:MAG TPA: CBS domain-containing protein [Stellaceae bacterium]|nr:CBS domain-containing protein [Stellaceae bacterium]
MFRRIVPDLVRDQMLTELHPTTFVSDAASIMAERNIGAVMVCQDGRLVGIFTERDVVKRVVAHGLQPTTTRLAEVMTANPDTVSPDEAPHRALEMMRSRGYRHLPVVDAGRVVGMCSIRDLYAAIAEDLEADLKQRDEFIMGSYSLSA